MAAGDGLEPPALLCDRLRGCCSRSSFFYLLLRPIVFSLFFLFFPSRIKHVLGFA